MAVSVAIGGVAWVFLYPLLSGERKAEKRKEIVVRSGPVARAATAARTTQRSRREQVEETLKGIEKKGAPQRFVPIQTQIVQAGLTISKRQFFVGSGVLGVVVFLLGLFMSVGLLPALAAGFAAAFGLPRWILGFLKKRREKQFLAHFPDAVDIVVRGIKAGLPLLDGLRIITTESPEPVRSEIRTILETQTVGIPLGEACTKLYERIPLPEANFFGIVIAIQQKAGGNLSEALGNLSRVLRERKKMQAKIQAMSMEAKASASIIAALPICVMLLVYLSSPDYISLLWTEPVGRMMLVMCATWMAIGVFVMKRMINFDF